MKKTALMMAVALMALSVAAEVIEKEGFVRQNERGYVKIANPANTKVAIASVDPKVADEVRPYLGKVIRISGEKHPDRSFPTFVTVEKIEVVDQ